MNKIYGLPYMGSKGRFVEDFFDIIPQKKRFYDLFHGGLAVTHYALLHTDVEVISNDLNKQIQDLFKNAVNGDYKNRNEYVSRETFFTEKENDPFIKYAWSFSCKGENYLYAKEIEDLKKAVYYYKVFGDSSLLRAFGCDSLDDKDDVLNMYTKWYTEKTFGKVIPRNEIKLNIEKIEANMKDKGESIRLYLCEGLKKANKRNVDIDRLLGTNGMAGHYFGKSQWGIPTAEAYEKIKNYLNLSKTFEELTAVLGTDFNRYQSLKVLAKLNHRFDRLETGRQTRINALTELKPMMNRLTLYNRDYREVPIEKDSVIYCDIPYENTEQYSVGDFNHAEFFAWCSRQTELVFISSYDMPKDKFTKVFEIEINRGLGGGAVVKERIFVPNHLVEKFNRERTDVLF
jgi:site-specific DNA-adenine methylase